jgi:hypothetical protein
MNALLSTLLKQRNTALICDVDGTVLEARYSDGNSRHILTHANTDELLYQEELVRDRYQDARPVQAMKDIIDTRVRNAQSTMFASCCHDDLEIEQKRKRLSALFPEMNMNLCYFPVKSDERRIRFIKDMAEVVQTYYPDGNLVYIDDNLDFLCALEDMLDADPIAKSSLCYFHISSLFI